jgi:hypothetical protein
LTPLAQAGTYTETFDSGLNPALWTVYTSTGSTVAVTEGKLVVTVPARTSDNPGAAAYIESTFNVGTAFSAQVDYNLTGYMLEPRGRAGICATPDDNAMRIQRDFWPDWPAHDLFLSSFHGNTSIADAGTNLVGSLRLGRDGASNAWAQYNTGSGWTDLGGMYNPGDGPIQLGLWAWPEGTGTTVYFDNFIVTPEPATLSLLALGGAAVLVRRKRK